MTLQRHSEGDAQLMQCNRITQSTEVGLAHVLCRAMPLHVCQMCVHKIALQRQYILHVLFALHSASSISVQLKLLYTVIGACRSMQTTRQTC